MDQPGARAGPAVRKTSIRRGLALSLLTGALALACAPDEAEVVLRVVDAATGAPVPARVEVLDAQGRPRIARDAIPIRNECLFAPLPEWLEPLQRSREVRNPYTGTKQFYVDGVAHLRLTSGSYRLRATKGSEYRRAEQRFEVNGDGPREVSVALERWADPAREGWYGADDHIHISRPRPELNAWIADWLAAEGLHVANLLQMGTAAQFSVTPQYAFGDAGAHRAGPLLLLAGQEHPRTHFLGHTIVLGAREPVDRREEYIVYAATFAEAERRGGVSGFAHWGIGNARAGLAISAPTGRVRFLEVLQYEFPYYEVWYQLLNLGVRVAPTAGTDFPCMQSLPGHERFYAHVEGPLDRAGFVAAVRAGRTFVSNGPLLELSVAGAGPGAEVALAAPGRLRVSGRVRFDAGQDRVDVLELVKGGVVVHSVSAAEGGRDGELRFDTEIPIEGSAWLALRASGAKRGEDAPVGGPLAADWVFAAADRYVGGGGGPELRDHHLHLTERPSAAHTAAVFVRVGEDPAPPPDRELASAWLERLDALEARLDDSHIAEIPILDWIPYSDGVSEEHLRRHRPALLKAIARAREFYSRLAQAGGA